MIPYPVHLGMSFQSRHRHGQLIGKKIVNSFCGAGRKLGTMEWKKVVVPVHKKTVRKDITPIVPDSVEFWVHLKETCGKVERISRPILVLLL